MWVLLMRKGRSRNDARRRGAAEERGVWLEKVPLVIFASLLTKKHGGVELDQGDPGFRNTIVLAASMVRMVSIWNCIVLYESLNSDPLWG